MYQIEPTKEQIRGFEEDGFIVFEKFLEPEEVARARARFERLFRGEFETGLYPDELNWQEGRDQPERTRQLCNCWKADYTVAGIVLRREIGRLAAALSGWRGTRLHLDNVLWKPPGARALVFHQDGSYNHYMVPNNMTSCWMALDDTAAEAGTVEYVRGSHKWGQFERPKCFLAADHDYRKPLYAAAAQAAVEPEIVPVKIPAGGLAVHHNWLWHGSGPNRAERPRRSLVAHCISSETRFHPTYVGYIYSRYKRVGETEMDESFFPILWREDGYRTPWLDDYIERGSAKAQPA